ncbi:hypothetical protein A7A08_03057 [Methyloligella halotolerans]|uniref:Uncharacterized protein n=1 Tax=Methyloligella halotolerans TaxID=1177755 RepID=A0A1E2RV08_9HYPH|nr:hypothetical protein [Methyloligella halotolerans]ODA66043.1 hypothetical protein A7A08_03057 [Methyloligella halotolerans]
MLISLCTELGEQRVYITRFASVLSYFTADEDTGGVTLHTEPGLMAWPSEYERNVEAVRQAIVASVAERLGVDPTRLFSVSMAALKEIAAPELPEHYRYARRSKNRAYPAR